MLAKPLKTVIAATVLAAPGFALPWSWDEGGGFNGGGTPLQRVIIIGQFPNGAYVIYDQSQWVPPMSVTRIGHMNQDQYDEYMAEQETQAANRKNPGCKREADFLNLVRQQGLQGNPMHAPLFNGFLGVLQDLTEYISGGVQDPRYQDPNWRKMEVAFQYFDADVGAPILLRAHYFWHQYTFAVEDLKLKNTPDQGCAGQVRVIV